MKKNKMMRLASGLLVAVLITTSTISGTYAKYVTQDSATDEARVAKFGVVVEAEGGLFAETYIDTPGGAADKLTVVSVGAVDDGVVDNVVAPGTENTEGITFTVTGKPEVDVKVTVDVTEETKDIFLANGTYADMTTGDKEDTFVVNETSGKYYPVKFTLTHDCGTGVTGTIAEVKEYLENLTATYDANTDLSTVVGEFNLTWAWDFGTAGAPATTADKADTLLGDMAADPSLKAKYVTDKFYPMADGQEYCLDVNFGVTVTVEQVD